jgi:hypothetical protein
MAKSVTAEGLRRQRHKEAAAFMPRVIYPRLLAIVYFFARGRGIYLPTLTRGASYFILHTSAFLTGGILYESCNFGRAKIAQLSLRAEVPKYGNLQEN